VPYRAHEIRIETPTIFLIACDLIVQQSFENAIVVCSRNGSWILKDSFKWAKVVWRRSLYSGMLRDE
jgi:hypothetical protein